MCGSILFPSNSIGCCLFAESLLFFLVVTVDDVSAFLAELVQSLYDDEGVYTSIEAAILTSLEAVEEEHQLGYLQVVELSGDNGCEVVELVIVQFVSRSAKLTEIGEMYDEPYLRSIVAECFELAE